MPHTYYTELQERVGKIDEPVEQLEELGILVDRDDEGYMLQIFTRPSKTARRCSSKSFSAREAAASARATSRRCLKRLSVSSSARGNL